MRLGVMLPLHDIGGDPALPRNFVQETGAIRKREALSWKKAGATHLTLTSMFNRHHHRRIPGRKVADHVAAQRRCHDAVADVL